MIRLFFCLVIICLCLSCTDENREPEKDVSIEEVEHTSRCIDCSTQLSEYSGLNTDMCIALFFWSDSIVDFDQSIEEYTRYALAKDTILFTIQTLFDECEQYEHNIKRIDHRADSFYRYTSKIFIDDVEQYGGVSDGRIDEYMYFANRPLYDSFLRKYPDAELLKRKKSNGSR